MIITNEINCIKPSLTFMYRARIMENGFEKGMPIIKKPGDLL